MNLFWRLISLLRAWSRRRGCRWPTAALLMAHGDIYRERDMCIYIYVYIYIYELILAAYFTS